jgi:hypothetical protein
MSLLKVARHRGCTPNNREGKGEEKQTEMIIHARTWEREEGKQTEEHRQEERRQRGEVEKEIHDRVKWKKESLSRRDMEEDCEMTGQWERLKLRVTGCRKKGERGA